MSLKDLIASPGHVAAANITKRFRYWGDAHADLFDAITEAVNDAMAQERERVILAVDEMCGSHNLTKRLRERLDAAN